MKINHFIVGAKDVPASVKFYCELFDFRVTEDDPGAKEGRVLEGSGCDLLILPFKEEKLPNPAHFAFEASDLEQFEKLFEKSQGLDLRPRTLPARDSAPGVNEFERAGKRYKNFYLFDPAGVNLEVMVCL